MLSGFAPGVLLETVKLGPKSSIEKLIPRDLLVQALLAIDQDRAAQVISTAGNVPTSIRSVDGLVVPALDQIGQGWEQDSTALSRLRSLNNYCEMGWADGSIRFSC